MGKMEKALEVIRAKYLPNFIVLQDIWLYSIVVNVGL